MINLEKGIFTLGAKNLGISLVAGPGGWYGIPYKNPEYPRMEWHLGKQWKATSGEIEGVPAVMERCQGAEAWQSGFGSGTVDFHGPFDMPQVGDHELFERNIICEKCYKAFRAGEWR